MAEKTNQGKIAEPITPKIVPEEIIDDIVGPDPTGKKSEVLEFVASTGQNALNEILRDMAADRRARRT